MTTTCPKCKGRAYRVFTQARKGNGLMTNVNLPFVLCASVVTTRVDGREIGTYKIGKGQHGLVPLDRAAWLAAQRQRTRLMGRAHPTWGHDAREPKAAAHAPAKPRTVRKPSPTPKAVPRPRAAPSRTPAKPPRRRRTAPAPPPPPSKAAEGDSTLTAAGKAVLAASPLPSA